MDLKKPACCNNQCIPRARGPAAIARRSRAGEALKSAAAAPSASQRRPPGRGISSDTPRGRRGIPAFPVWSWRRGRGAGARRGECSWWRWRREDGCRGRQGSRELRGTPNRQQSSVSSPSWVILILILIKNGPWAPWRGHALAHLSLTRWLHQHTTRTCRSWRAVAPGKRRPDVLGGRWRREGQPQEPSGRGGGRGALRSGGLARRRYGAAEEVVHGARAWRGEREERGHRPVLLPRAGGGGRGGARGQGRRRCVWDLGGVATGAGTSRRPWRKGEASEEWEGGR